MKTRTGFVSNSSSSSFLIMGLRVNNQEIAKISTKYLLKLINWEKFSKYYGDKLEDFEKKICCGKELKTSFCPTCGNKKEHVMGSFDRQQFLDRIIREYPPQDFGFFNTPEDGTYYCTRVGGKLANILEEREKFLDVAKVFYSDFPENENEQLEWLNNKLELVGGEYYN